MTFEIKELCQVNKSLSSDLLSIINNKHWKLDTSRQKKYEVHKFTETIRLRHVNELEFDNFKFFNYEMYEYYQPIINQYLEIISQNLIINDYTALLVNLKPKGFIIPHVDTGRYFELAHRLHIPIKTNKDVFFTVGTTTLNMKVGKIYEINNLIQHSVSNNSVKNRIHLIIDIF